MKKTTSKSVLRRLSIQLDKPVKKCKPCKGTGEIVYGHSYHDIRDKRMCLTCGGKGYTIKKKKL